MKYSPLHIIQAAAANSLELSVLYIIRATFVGLLLSLSLSLYIPPVPRWKIRIKYIRHPRSVNKAGNYGLGRNSRRNSRLTVSAPIKTHRCITHSMPSSPKE